VNLRQRPKTIANGDLEIKKIHVVQDVIHSELSLGD